MKAKNDYRPTLQLPKTSFPMRGNLLQLEPRLQLRWEGMDLYRRIRSTERPRGSYVLHDGPPYANGPIHMGHLLNKTLKDLVVRTRLMAGYDANFVPGWDCHGLPIEHKVLKEFGPASKELTTPAIRQRCHEYATRYVALQAEQLKRLGTMATYGSPYLTMQPEYEGAVLEVFARLAEQGLVYRDLKPVHWSIENRTALADAELEYYERTDSSIYVMFPVRGKAHLPDPLNAPPGQDVWLMIWTTTPWTLPANEAVAVAPEAEYSLVRFTREDVSRLSIVARELVERVFSRISGAEVLGSCLGSQLVESGISYEHPFREKRGPVLEANYVTLEDGTGLVHTAPGHGTDDYLTGSREGLPIYCPVQEDGTFDTTVPEWLQGLSVWEANPSIVDHLRETGALFHHEDFLHSYPHDWRSKTPTIFRATEQWFVGVDRPFGEDQQSLRERALLAARESISFVPDWGRNRLTGMLESRPDWCISRQRAWGLPIPAFFASGGELVLTPDSIRAVAGRFAESGSDVWFRETPEQLLRGYDPAADPQLPESLRASSRDTISGFRKSNDIFDVWFESGSSWNAVLRRRKLGYPADLYLEGSDQHRGWFQLSMLPALGATGKNPFLGLLTHGFMVDATGRKMSKALGNVIDVADILKQHGADICRWWVSSLNYTNDIKADWEFFRVASEEYRKIRNTIRFLLGNLSDFRPELAVRLTDEDRYSIDSWAMQELSRFLSEVHQGYDSYRFKTASDAIFNFCNQTMSAVYLAAVKDRLYCDPQNGRRRRRAQTVMHRIADSLIRAAAPIIVHTAEEAWLRFQGLSEESEESVHLHLLPETFDFSADPGWSEAMALRAEALRALEEAKNPDGGGLKNPLDAAVTARVSEQRLETLRPLEPEMADLCGVSRFQLQPAAAEGIEIQDLREDPRCERSWKRDGTVRQRSDGGWLSDRDAQVLGLK